MTAPVAIAGPCPDGDLLFFKLNGDLARPSRHLRGATEAADAAQPMQRLTMLDAASSTGGPADVLRFNCSELLRAGAVVERSAENAGEYDVDIAPSRLPRQAPQAASASPASAQPIELEEQKEEGASEEDQSMMILFVLAGTAATVRHFQNLGWCCGSRRNQTDYVMLSTTPASSARPIPQGTAVETWEGAKHMKPPAAKKHAANSTMSATSSKASRNSKR